MTGEFFQIIFNKTYILIFKIVEFSLKPQLKIIFQKKIIATIIYTHNELKKTYLFRFAFIFVTSPETKTFIYRMNK